MRALNVTTSATLLERAVHNNALWCDAVCAAHGSPGEFSAILWSHRHGAPRHYPDAITLTGSETVSAQGETISSLINSQKREWAVKDSFHCLDLRPMGFTVLFDAEWIGISSPVREGSNAQGTLRWERVRDESGLRRWERIWAGTDWNSGAPQLFKSRLLSNADVVFLIGFEDDAPVSGGILNRGAEAVGISNVFSSGISGEIVRRDLVIHAHAMFPNLPIVGYERDDDLADSLRAGFETIGCLRVWHCQQQTSRTHAIRP